MLNKGFADLLEEDPAFKKVVDSNKLSKKDSLVNSIYQIGASLLYDPIGTMKNEFEYEIPQNILFMAQG